MGAKSSKTDTENAAVKKNGEPTKYDPTFRGPIKNRGCTDVPCCILFIVFILAFLAIGIYAFAMGDPRYLVYPIDSSGNLCGTRSQSGKPYLFYFNLVECVAGTGTNVLKGISNFEFKFCPTTQICVEKCPTTFWAALGPDSEKAICRYNVTQKPKNIAEAVKSVERGDCAPFYVPSEPVVYRCLPSPDVFKNNASVLRYNGTALTDRRNHTVNVTDLELAIKAMKGEYNAIEDYGIRILGDVAASWWLILIFVTIAMVVSFIWIVLMRWLAGFIVWLSVALFVGFFIFAIIYCFTKYNQLKDTTSQWIVTKELSYYGNLKETWLALGIIAIIILAITVLLLLFLITRIRIAIALIKEASRAIGYMIFTLFWPLVPYLLQMVLLAYWGASALCLAAISRTDRAACQYYVNEAYGNDTGAAGSDAAARYSDVRCWLGNTLSKVPCNSSAGGLSGSICDCFKSGNCDPRYTLVLQAFQLFMWFWLMNFIIALGQMTLAGAFASYYWAFSKPGDIPMFPVASSLGRAMRYHTGSMAFGALLIAIVQFIIAILTYLDHKLKGRENMLARFLLKCLLCCFYCLEHLLKFINKNAYIMIAVYGKNFCTSAKNAFSLLLRNLIRVVVVDKVTDLIIFVSKLFVVGAVGVLAYFFFAREIPGIYKILPELQLNYYLIPVLIIIAATYIVATAFFSVYNMGVDTLFLCFLEDLERHDGSAEKPYYMNRELMAILGKKNKTPKQS